VSIFHPILVELKTSSASALRAFAHSKVGAAPRKIGILPRLETVIDNLPGYPDNINPASDGNYWLALVGMRSPALDLDWGHAGLPQAGGQAGSD
jgi:sugar lactone lactonase YvrE